AIRRVSTRVFPEPAPATTSRGPPVCVTASRWAGLRSSSRARACAARLRSAASRAACSLDPAVGPEPERDAAWPGTVYGDGIVSTGLRVRADTHRPGQASRRLGGESTVPWTVSDQPAVVRPPGELVPAGQLELAQHAGDVGLDRLDRDEQFACDLLVGIAARDQPHHLALAVGEPVQVLVDLGHLDGPGEGVQHEAREPRG